MKRKGSCPSHLPATLSPSAAGLAASHSFRSTLPLPPPLLDGAAVSEGRETADGPAGQEGESSWVSSLLRLKVDGHVQVHRSVRQWSYLPCLYEVQDASELVQ